jgi:hypothetical protein
MFGLKLQRKRTSTPARTRRARPSLEALEGRDCPAAPTLTLTATAQAGHTVLLSGIVTDDNPKTVTVTLGGVMMGTVTPDDFGVISCTSSATSLGTVTAVARDAAGLTSATDYFQIADAPPVVQGLTVAYGQGRCVILSGTVSDQSPGGLTVAFSGAACGSTTTASDGSFRVQLQATSLGDVQAVATDPWGLLSDPAHATVANSPPQITAFNAVHGLGNTWTFSGTVVDESPQGLRVQFGGLASLTNQAATADEQGNFSLTLSLQPNERGTATATVTDPWGATSAEAAYPVNNC